MSVVSAFLVPGSPLPCVHPGNPPWGKLAHAMNVAGQSLAASEPDTIIVYSTQWIAVLDQLWQTRPHLEGVHVDENWHEYGDLPFSIDIDTELAERAVAATNAAGIKSKGVNYDQFPIDTGTIVAAHFLNRKVAIAVVGGLSGTSFRHAIDIGSDHIAAESEDAWNRKILQLMEKGDVEALLAACPQYAAEAKVDMGFKHLAFLLGALGGQFSGATVHGYGPLYGTGGAVVEFNL